MRGVQVVKWNIIVFIIFLRHNSHLHVKLQLDPSSGSSCGEDRPFRSHLSILYINLTMTNNNNIPSEDEISKELFKKFFML